MIGGGTENFAEANQGAFLRFGGQCDGFCRRSFDLAGAFFVELGDFRAASARRAKDEAAAA